MQENTDKKEGPFRNIRRLFKKVLNNDSKLDVRPTPQRRQDSTSLNVPQNKQEPESTPATQEDILDYEPYSTYETFKRGVTWIWDGIVPLEYRSYEPTEEEKATLEKQARDVAARNAIRKRTDKKNDIIKNNYKKDLGIFQQKKQIFTNWYDYNTKKLADQKHQDLGLAINDNSTFSEGTSNYQGQADLCESLKCNGTVFETKVETKQIIDPSTASSLTNCKNEVQSKIQQIEILQQKNQQLTQLTQDLHTNYTKYIQIVNENLCPPPSQQVQVYSSQKDNSGGVSPIPVPLLPQAQYNYNYNNPQYGNGGGQGRILAIQGGPANTDIVEGIPIVESETDILAELFAALISFPAQITDKKSAFWKSQIRKKYIASPPHFIIRWMITIAVLWGLRWLLITLYSLLQIAIEVISYKYNLIPNKKQETTKKKKKETKERQPLGWLFSSAKQKEKEDEDEENEENKEDEEKKNPGFGERLSKASLVFLKPRGGAVGVITSQEVELLPIFAFILMQKAISQLQKTYEKELKQLKIYEKERTKRKGRVRKFLKTIKKNRSFGLYVALAIASLDFRTTNVSVPKNSHIQFTCRDFLPTACGDNLRLKIGEVIIQVGEPSRFAMSPQQENSILEGASNIKTYKTRYKTRIRKRAKLMKFSDLPPLSREQFPESFTRSKIQPIRVKIQQK